MTTRGLAETDVAELAGWMCDILEDLDNEALIGEVRGKVLALCRRFPVYRQAA